MITTAESFVFNGKSSELYNLAIVWINDSLETVSTGLSREIKKGETNMVRKVANQYGATYSSPLEISFGVIHKDGTPFDSIESRTINQWLTGSDNYQKLKFNDDDATQIYFKAICTNIEDFNSMGLIGKKLTFTCDGYCSYMDYEKSFSVNNSQKINIYSSSSEKYCYPIIKLSVKSDNSVITIENETDNKSLTLKNLKAGDYTIDCRFSKVNNANGNPVSAYTLGWNDDYKSVGSNGILTQTIYFPRLLQGKNMLNILGNCTITFKCEFTQKTGVF